ncbi:hypothetical protein BX616_000519 [Lobosporangium transversale]|uniref:Copper acquisition factor BIM1-like domain-containing protein n=1 Tax=Lobosporangium transversale TaxID=64571 RepID=A0A1Y2GW65_9FUNG|nr:hypothetical protein BCR41DRAFT_333255 [Lobosporangium transversale]KAF9907156.1 hypothetical protein BX616_000519 [Lobosporangium transversale]ORZ26509.1 hypothetical protein BCR41DRAFT_333255 [Lobosporangium transversale]|eukprot:XP_021884274.1 hypothetical protein BCR41DRAFT_333255 [Lobosporangium transversale]
MKALSIATLLLCSSAAMAHYTLDYPPTRGLNEDNEPIAPCGGFATVGQRSQFPLSKGFVTINSGHVKAEIKINVAYGNNPSEADFTAAASTPASSSSVNHPGSSCLPLDLSSFKGAADNTNATIQIVYNGGDSPLYQCADVILVNSAPSFDQSKCVNDDGKTPSTTNPGANPSNTPSAGAVLSVKNAFTAAAAMAMAAALAF